MLEYRIELFDYDEDYDGDSGDGEYWGREVE